MRSVYVSGHTFELFDSLRIGTGGEAAVYKLGPKTVVKIFFGPDHPDYQHSPQAQEEATRKIDSLEKLIPTFPKNLPDEVVVPQQLAYTDDQRTQIVGYSMAHIKDAHTLHKLRERSYRERINMDGNRIIDLFKRLHDVVSRIHSAGVVIGDFNDGNVLVDESDIPYLIDADSMQFGSFRSAALHPEFVDPLICVPGRLVLNDQYHNTDSDWYAYTMMLFRSLLFTGPYAGVYRSEGGKTRLDERARMFRRISVFDPRVLYKPRAYPLESLSEELLAYFQDVFEKDRRGPFPLHLLDTIRWTRCVGCGTLHARAECPRCSAPGIVQSKSVIRGRTTSTRIHHSHVLYATIQAGKLRHVSHEGGVFTREFGEAVGRGEWQEDMRVRVQGDNTLLSVGNHLLIVGPTRKPMTVAVDTFNGQPCFDANHKHRLWIADGKLIRDERHGRVTIGEVEAGNSCFWVGEQLGFVLMFDGTEYKGSVFNPSGFGLNFNTDLSWIPGRIVDVNCVFDRELVWLAVKIMLPEGVHPDSISEWPASTRKAYLNGELTFNVCYVMDKAGNELGWTVALSDEEGWLTEDIHGITAMNRCLYVPTPNGIAQYKVSEGKVVLESKFPDTKPYLKRHARLLPAKNGMYICSPTAINHLVIRRAATPGKNGAINV